MGTNTPPFCWDALAPSTLSPSLKVTVTMVKLLSTVTPLKHTQSP